MWIFTKNGFFSAVEHYQDKETVHVRARFKGDLENLCQEYRIEPDVQETPFADYPYRMNFPKKDWAEIVRTEAMDIDYTNFKDAVHEGTKRDDAYMGCWFSLRKNQG